MFVMYAAGMIVPVALPVLAVEQPSSYQRAVLARHAGNPSEAARLLEQWLLERPGDIDAMLQHGYALLDLGRLAAAKIEFQRVLASAPDYVDAKIGLARIAQRHGDIDTARALLNSIPVSSVDAGSMRQQLVGAAWSPWSVDLGASAATVGRGQSAWREVSGQLSYRTSELTSVSGRIERSRRFGLRDTYSEAQVVHRASPTITAHLLVGGTSKADYRPRWQIGGGLSARIQSGYHSTVVTLDLRGARYASGRITTLRPGVEQHLFGGKARVAGQVIAVVDRGRTHVGTLGRLDVQPSKVLNLFAGAAIAPDTSEGVVTRNNSLFGGIEASLRSRQVVRVFLAHVDQQIGASRTEFALGIGARF